MKKTRQEIHRVGTRIALAILFLLTIVVTGSPPRAFAETAAPLVAIHVSELTQALETMPATPPTPTGAGTTGFQWMYTSWHYFVASESLKEALRSDGTPFIVVSDSDIAAGMLLNSDGTPHYPIVISLDAEAIGDNEIAPLRAYVAAGGFLFSNASSFTRYPDGTARGDFALATEMGIHSASAGFMNWNQNLNIKKMEDQRLIAHLPSGILNWRYPLTADEISTGTTPPSHQPHNAHYSWQVVSTDAEVLALGNYGPLLTIKSYGNGQFIYHALLQPLIGHGGFDPAMYAYLIYRKAIEWSFESFSLPIVKVSPWRYPYDAAFLVRHDLENIPSLIQSVEASSQTEFSLGAKGDYFFCTGALRDDMGGDAATVTGLKNAVTKYGATIGSHNGGLKNPVNTTVTQLDYDYWHWGPDEALDATPLGYSSGKEYAKASILASFNDINGWLSGLDNGRTGCGALINCPRIWVSPAFNATREDSYDLLSQLNAITAGEQKISPFPHWTMSYKTAGKRYPQVSLPVSDWYVNGDIAQSNEYHTMDSIQAGIDFYYNLGTMINFYGHYPSNNNSVQQKYVTYGMSKPRLWSTNSVGIYDWWNLRNNVTVTPTVTTTGTTFIAKADISGATDPDTAIEVVIPANYSSDRYVFLDGKLTDTSNYRTTTYGVKIRVGSTVSNVIVQNAPNTPPVANSDAYTTDGNVALNQAAPGVLANDTDTEGASLSAQLVSGPAHGTLSLKSDGSFTYTPTTNYSGSDSFTYKANDGAVGGNTATVTITVLPAVTLTSLSIDPNSLEGGYPATGTVTLSRSPLNADIVVTLSDNSSYATVPSSVTVPAGSSTATFTVTTYTVTSAKTLTVSAVYGGVTKTAILTVNPPTVYTITGAISPAPSGSGATVALKQGSTTIATVTADANGAYTFSAIKGSYTVTPTKTGITFTPVAIAVSISDANVTGINFTTAGLAVDVTTYKDSSTFATSITTPTFTTRAGNELLLAFVSAAAATSTPNVTAISGGGLTWTMVRRANAQMATAEIWKAVATAPLTNVSVTASLSQSSAASITLVSFAGVNTSTPVGAVGGGYAATGAPTASLTTQGANSWVFGVGTAWEHATARTLGANQTMVHQNLDPNDYTAWVQRQNATTQPTGTVVTINDTAPLYNNWNMSIVEILVDSPTASNFISGTITPAPSGSGATVTLSQGAATIATATANGNGTYTFPNVANGSYTVTPTKSGFTFTPASAVVTVNGASVTGINFTAAGLAIDVTTSADKSTFSTSIATPAFSTSAGNELLLAFVSAAASTTPNVSSMSGGGLTWTLVQRANAQLSTAEIWKAVASAPLTNVTVTASLSQSSAASITLVAFAGVNPTTPVGAAGSGYAASGAPTASLTTQGANSWVYGVGTAWDHSTARTLGTNQTMVHQNLDPNDYTAWVQRQNATAQPGGTVVTINDTAPASDRWNLSIVEIRQ